MVRAGPRDRVGAIGIVDKVNLFCGAYTPRGVCMECHQGAAVQTMPTDTLNARDALTEQLLLVAIAARTSALRHLLADLQEQQNLILARAYRVA